MKYSIKKFSNNYKIFDLNDINYFKSILPQDCIQTTDLDKYNIDWMNKYKGKSPCVLKPKTTQHVSDILKYCNSSKLAIVPQGGNTGLVGGSVPVYDEIILSLEKMHKIISFDELSGTLHCEAGCILQNLEEYVAKKGYTMPIDLGAKGSCFIGGNLATNAGGIHYVQHGSLRRNCKGIKAVLADGTVIDSLNPLPKNNTGYDLKQLFIGSEGTLGIITECLINTPIRNEYSDVILVSLDKYEDIIRIYRQAKRELKDCLSAIEFFDNYALDVQKKSGKKSPFGIDYSFYLLIEVSSNDPNNIKILEEFIQHIDVTDGFIAQNEIQKKEIWELRETIVEGASKSGLILSYDISVPLENFYEVVEQTRARVGMLGNVIAYGHIGDYNLHLNVINKGKDADENFIKLEELMEPFFFDLTAKFKGSISAEHGIGVNKIDYLNRTQTDNSIDLMKIIKTTLDPNGILNPYKLLKI